MDSDGGARVQIGIHPTGFAWKLESQEEFYAPEAVMVYSGEGLGDWFVDTKKFPLGLGHFVDQLKALNMKFGIWFEPEMISPNSDLYRARQSPCTARSATSWI